MYNFCVIYDDFTKHPKIFAPIFESIKLFIISTLILKNFPFRTYFRTYFRTLYLFRN